MAPSLPTLVWRDWEPALTVDLLSGLAVLAYLTGVVRVRRWPLRRTASFLAGVGVLIVALQSGVDAFDDRLLSDHMVQHLLLLQAAPLLMLAGRPAMLALRAAPRSRRASIARRYMALAPLTRPLTCLAVFWVVVLGTHLPAFYDATLTNSGLHELEHGLYIVAGVFVWWPLLDGDPIPARRLSGMGRLAYLIASMLPMVLIGAGLYRDPTLFYAPYAAPAHALGISALNDQALAGVIMWVLGTCGMAAAGLWQVMAALVAEERRMEMSERAAVAGVRPDPGGRP